MDRARAAGYVENNYVQQLLNKKKREEHLRRIEKIKHRKPGSSATLDNTPPVIIEAMLNDPRKSASRQHFNFITEQENKVLLKRISTILTAPPKITDKEYQEMKKLVIPTTKGFRKGYEQKIIDKKNAEFFVHLKKLKPYYKTKEWEKDYEKQLFNQKFMRQVRYKRPPGFKDPFAAAPVDAEGSTADGKKGKKTLPQLSASAPTTAATTEDGENQEISPKSASHIAKVRAMKQSSLRKSLSNKGGSSGKARGGSSNTPKSRDSNRSGGKSGGGGSGDEGDEYGFDFDNEEDQGGVRVTAYGDYDMGEMGFEDSQVNADENRIQLAIIHRVIRITDDGPGEGAAAAVGATPTAAGSSALNLKDSLTNALDGTASVDELLVNGQLMADADIQCWLINQEYIVISAVTMDKGRLFDAEAEISVANLSVIRGLPLDQTLLQDLSALEAIARDMVDNVEMKVENGVCRLVLNLISDGDEDDEYSLSDSEAGGVGSPMGGPNASAHMLFNGSQTSLATEEEVESMLLTDKSDVILRKGVLLTVSFNVNANAQSIGSISALMELSRRAKMIEKVYALLTFMSANDDQIVVVAHFVTSTAFQFKRGTKHRPAVMENTSARASTSLPSVIQADPELLVTFAENLSKYLKVEHDCKSGENELLIIN